MKFINVCFPALFATGALAKAVAVPDPAARLVRNQATRDLLVNEGAKPMTILGEEFCQVYYILDDGKCETLRDSIRSEIRGESGTPTLELGDPAEKPVLLFFHGWPDTYAMWANQFAHFCGEDGEYACVAPSAMDYNPDVPPADESKLWFPLQADIMHEVVMELDLKDITLIGHDFGSIVGAMYATRHAKDVKRIIIMDVSNAPGKPQEISDATIPTLFPFQQGAINSYRTKNDQLMQETIDGMAAAFGGLGPPCTTCKITPDSEVPIGYRVGWMHEQFVNPTYRTYFDTPVEDWEFTLTPTWPDSVPQLFLWAFDGFHGKSLLTWLDSRGDGSGHRRISGDHWFMLRNISPGLDTVSDTNAAMEEFFGGTFESDVLPTTTGPTSAPGATTAATAAPTTAPPDDDKSGSMSSRAMAVAGCVVPLAVSMFLA